jgi:hypothetical protein
VICFLALVELYANIAHVYSVTDHYRLLKLVGLAVYMFDGAEMYATHTQLARFFDVAAAAAKAAARRYNTEYGHQVSAISATP